VGISAHRLVCLRNPDQVQGHNRDDAKSGHDEPAYDGALEGTPALTRLPAPTAQELLARMEKRMALKDAEIALIVGQHAAALSAFVSWNAKHFAGKIGVPSLTPREWLGGEAGRRKRT
jgi:hypothetical protein